MSTQTVSHTDNVTIPDGTGSLRSTIALASSERLDKVVVDLNITHPHVSDLTVTLTAPDGTSALLVNHPGSGTGAGIVFETTANDFWGEDAKGNWTLTVTDNVTGNAGTLNSWTLTALGDAPSTPTTYIYTDEFATTSGAARTILNVQQQLRDHQYGRRHHRLVSRPALRCARHHCRQNASDRNNHPDQKRLVR